VKKRAYQLTKRMPIKTYHYSMVLKVLVEWVALEVVAALVLYHLVVLVTRWANRVKKICLQAQKVVRTWPHQLDLRALPQINK
jgi:hypothetical protein